MTAFVRVNGRICHEQPCDHERCRQAYAIAEAVCVRCKGKLAWGPAAVLAVSPLQGIHEDCARNLTQEAEPTIAQVRRALALKP